MQNRYTYNALKESYRREFILKYNVENFEEIPKMLREIKKMLKNKNIDFIDFEVKVNYFLPEWVNYLRKYEKNDKK